MTDGGFAAIAVDERPRACVKRPGKGAWSCDPRCTVERHRPGYRSPRENRTPVFADETRTCAEGHAYRPGAGCGVCHRIADRERERAKAAKARAA